MGKKIKRRKVRLLKHKYQRDAAAPIVAKQKKLFWQNIVDPVPLEKQKLDRPNESILNKYLVIKLGSTWKSLFDIVLLFACVVNTVCQAYYAAFGLPTDEAEIALDYAVEALFWLDFLFCFCQEFVDEKSFMVVSDLKAIAKHYLRGSCLYDLLACIPVAYIVNAS